ncbi:MAG TPA: NUDIX domain-containing protein [Puia sp.]|nr:NUDIX domain-containing protein [Puia sp.]
MMERKVDLRQWLSGADNEFLPHISLDCVVFGFHDGALKILLLKMQNLDQLALPGGFMMREETLEEAAIRTLEERTGLENIFLQQFHVFSDPARNDSATRLEDLKKLGMHPAKLEWFAQRFISVGFYALVEFSRVRPKPDVLSESCDWYSLEERGKLVLDHDQILDTALATLRMQLNHQPVGYNLLPRKFTMPELQKLYETILDKKLDRRNFQRKMLSYGILNVLDEKRTGGAYKAPYLYSFHLRNYQKALRQGLEAGA